MRILIPALSSATHPDGVSRHAVNLVRCLLNRREIEAVDLIIGRWQADCFRLLLGKVTSKLHLHTIDIKPSSLARNLWYYTELPYLAHRLRSSLIHLTYPMPIHHSRFECPIVVTLHDLYPYDIPQNFGYPRVFLNRIILNHCLAAASAITCVSASTVARLQLHNPALIQKSSLIYNSVENESVSRSLTAPSSRLTQQPFLLAIAQHRKNKNIPLTLHIFKRLLAHHPSLLLCLVGREGPETALLLRLIKLTSIQSNVLLLNNISDQQLQWCYSHAELLLATSTVEGFGLPIAEAMLAGCPIVCSDIQAFRELGQGFCHFMPSHEQAFVDAIETTFALPRPAPVKLPQLSASTIAPQYIDLYRTLLSIKSPTQKDVAA
jgi:glycosyltransferase involved in cell wall biosynthesis